MVPGNNVSVSYNLPVKLLTASGYVNGSQSELLSDPFELLSLLPKDSSSTRMECTR